MPRTSARFALAIGSLSYVALGIVGSAIGPILPELAGRTGNDLAALGGIFVALFSGGLVAQIVGGAASDRFGQRPVMVIGLLLLGAGIVGVSLGRSLEIILACSLIAGLGHGSVDIGSNLVVVAAFTRRNVSALNLLHLFFGAGSMAGPAVVALTLSRWGTGLPALWLGSALLFLLVPLAGQLSLPRQVAAESDARSAGASTVFRSPLAWLSGLLLLVYVGTEMGFGGWTTAYLGQAVHMETASAALVTSGFWGMLTVGRFLGALLATRLAPASILQIDLTGNVLASILLIASGTSTFANTLGILLLGLTLGSIYPTVVAIVTGAFREGQGKAASIITAGGSVGGMTLPWLAGVLLEYRGVTAIPVFALVCSVVMLGLFALSRSLMGRRRTATN